MVIGIFLMVMGSVTIYFEPMPATVEVGPVKISDIDPLPASLIGVGAIIFIAGIGLYLKDK